MYQITEENRPKCFNFEKCENKAIAFINDLWICSACLIKMQENITNQTKSLVLKE